MESNELIIIPLEIINSNLIQLRKNYKLFAISNFVNLFKRHINLEFDTEELEADLDGTRPNSCVPSLLGKLLNTLANDRNVNSTNWLNALRRQYTRRQPDANPFVAWVEVISSVSEEKKELADGAEAEEIPVASTSTLSNSVVKEVEGSEKDVVMGEDNRIEGSGLTGEEKKLIETNSTIVIEITEGEKVIGDSEGIKMDIDSLQIVPAAEEAAVVIVPEVAVPVEVVAEAQVSPILEITPVASQDNNNNNNNNNTNNNNIEPKPEVVKEMMGDEEGVIVADEDNVLWREVEVSWEAVDLETKIDAIYNVCEWHMQETERFRRLLKGPDEIDWRMEPIGFDSLNNKYFYSMDDQRLWVQHPPPPKPGSKLKVKLISKYHSQFQEDSNSNSNSNSIASSSKARISTSKSKSRSVPADTSRAPPKDRSSLPTTSTPSSSRSKRTRTDLSGGPSSSTSNSTPTTASRLRSVVVPPAKQKLRGSRSRVGRAEVWEEIPEELLAEWQEPDADLNGNNAQGEGEKEEAEDEEVKPKDKKGKGKKLSTPPTSSNNNLSESNLVASTTTATTTTNSKSKRNTSVTSSGLSEVSDFEQDDPRVALMVIDNNEEDDDYVPDGDEGEERVFEGEEDNEEVEEVREEEEAEEEVEEEEVEEDAEEEDEKMEVDEKVQVEGEIKEESDKNPSIVNSFTAVAVIPDDATAGVVAVVEELPEANLMKWEKDYWAERARCDVEGFIEWEAVCITVQDWEDFAAGFNKTKNQKEKALRDFIQIDIMPYVVEAAKEKEERRIAEIAAMNRKRSSRIAIKESAHEEDARISLERAETSSRLSRASRHKVERTSTSTPFMGYDETGSNGSGGGSGSGTIVIQETREERLRKREEEKLAKRAAIEAAAIEEVRLAERQAAIDANGGIVPPGMETPEELAAIKLEKEKETKKNAREENKKGKLALKKKSKLEKAAAKKALKEELNPEVGMEVGIPDYTEDEPWFLECEVCLKSGWNLDDGSEVISCDRCDDWQHLECHVLADEKAGREPVDYDTINFYCAKCTREPYRKLPNRKPPAYLPLPHQAQAQQHQQQQSLVAVQVPTPKSGKKSGKVPKGGINNPASDLDPNMTPTGKEKRKYKPRAPKVGEDGLPLPPPAKKQKKEKVLPIAKGTGRAFKGRKNSNAGPSYENVNQYAQHNQQEQYQRQSQQQQQQQQQYQAEEAPRPRVPGSNEPPLDYPALVKLITANPILVNDLPAAYQAHFAALLNIPVPYPDTRALQFAPLPSSSTNGFNNNNNGGMNGNSSSSYSNSSTPQPTSQPPQQQQQPRTLPEASTSSSTTNLQQPQSISSSTPITFATEPQAVQAVEPVLALVGQRVVSNLIEGSS